MSHPTLTIDDVAARIPDAPPGVTPTREEIAAAASLVGETFKPHRIVLFGSRAYGVPKPGSDVDLMVVMETAGRSGDEERRIRQAIGYGRPGHWQIIVRTPAEIRRGLAERDFFIRDAMAKGITLYEGGTMDSDDDADDGEDAGSAAPGLKYATLNWLERAEEDYDGALHLLSRPRPLYNLVAFHAQQCIEKALKGLLQEHEIEFPRTHDLVALAALCGSLVPDLFALERTLEQLTDWAVEPRYSDRGLTEAEINEAVRVMTTVRTLVHAALGLPEA